MSPHATLLVLLSAGLHVAWNSMAKASASPVLFMGAKGGFLLLVAAVAVPMIGIAGVPEGAWLPIVASGVLHALYALALARAYEHGDISFVYPIARSAPALVPLFAWSLLGERLTWPGGAGIALVVGCVLLLQVREGGFSLGSIGRSLWRVDGRWALATLACVITYTLVDKVGMRALSTSATLPAFARGPLYFLLENGIAYAIYLAALWARPPAGGLTVLRDQWQSALLAAMFTMASYSLILHVMQTEPVSYIVAVRQCSVVLASLYGWLALRERQGPTRLALSALIVAGVSLVVWFG